ncbi:MAG: aspartate/tyrosine/aromatic aminotransferase [bacterium]|nr:aspartate/tyrosine/aromatic aminotransferase [bacterium]
MFKHISMAPPDAIFGLIEDFRNDPHPDKINLSAGVYADEHGRTPVLAVVKEAERRIRETEQSKAYLPIHGSAEYAGVIQRLLFGEDHEIIAGKRAATAHAPGGTGALRVVGDFLKKHFGDTTIWFSEPTWINHYQVYKAAGLAIATYPYFDAERNALAFDEMIAGLEKVRPGDVVLLHGCCHNPSGVDPHPEQWEKLGDLLAARQALPLVDFAYQGFANGVEEDAAGIRILCRKVPELLICSSYSKNFGLYNERVGALTAVAASAEAAQAVLSHVKGCARANYSNPPAHGAAIVTTILNDAELRQEWEAELRKMRERIHSMRKLLAARLDARGVKLAPPGNQFIVHQNGMFSFSGLNKDQVATLRDKYSIYIVGSGRINVGGITESNIDRLGDAIASVL